jgi:hypothetical protein
MGLHQMARWWQGIGGKKLVASSLSIEQCFITFSLNLDFYFYLNFFLLAFSLSYLISVDFTSKLS